MNATSLDELRSIVSSLELDEACKQALQAPHLDRTNGMTDELKNAIGDVAAFEKYLAANPVAC